MSKEDSQSQSARLYRIIRVKKNAKPGTYKIYLEEAVSPKSRRKGKTKTLMIDHKTFKEDKYFSSAIVEEYYQLILYNKYMNTHNEYFKDQVKIVKSMAGDLKFCVHNLEKKYQREDTLNNREDNKRKIMNGEVHMKKIRKKKDRELVEYFHHFYKFVQEKSVVEFDVAMNGLKKMYGMTTEEYNDA